MKIEHFAINVEDPLALAGWYEKNLGLKVVKQAKKAPFTTFLADDSGRVMLEVYNNPADQVPDYKNMDPLILHLAFVSEDPVKDRDRLTGEGASVLTDDQPGDAARSMGHLHTALQTRNTYVG